METERKIYTTVVVVALVGLLFSCVAGALAGGVAGLFMGRRQGRVAAERALAEGREAPLLPQIPEWEQEERPTPVPERGLPPVGMEGALVMDVVAGTPAEEAGLQVGDIIVAVDRTPVNAAHPLPDVIGRYRPGDRVHIRFWRGDREQSVTVKLAANPKDPESAYLGVYFEMLNAARPGD